MKKFLVAIVKIFVLNVLLWTLLLGGTYYIVSSASFRLPEEKDVLVIGDSHTECAIDDSIFSRAFNISQSGTAYLYSYVKLKKFLEVNPRIHTTFVSFHGESIRKALDEWTVGDKFIFKYLPSHISLFSRKELAALARESSFYSAIMKVPFYRTRAILKFILYRSLTFSDLHIGGYVKLHRDKLQKDIELTENNMAAGTNEGGDEYSTYQLAYLLQIVALCREKGVEVILFNPPTYHPARYGNLPALAHFYNTYFPGVKYLDYSDFSLPGDAYSDIGHLNFKGATIFSHWLRDNHGPSGSQLRMNLK
jgi:hypothetical protein